MLKLNKMTDYAILVLGILYMRADEALTSPTIAQHTQLTQTTVAKVIKLLVAAGLVTTTRGVKGGCHLVRPAESITIAEVIEAIEGPIALTACVEGASDPCSVQAGCFMSGNWNKVNKALRHALMGLSLNDLYDPAHLFPTAPPPPPSMHNFPSPTPHYV